MISWIIRCYIEIMKRRKIKITSSNLGQRLDKFLKEELPDYSRSYIQKLVKSGNVKIFGHLCLKPGFLVEKPGFIEVILPDIKNDPIKPEPIKLDILYKDEEILVINKPAGLVSYPDTNYQRGTLVNALLYYLGEEISQVERFGVVHRLDKGTSGVMVIARTKTTSEFLKEQFKKHKIQKTYLALVEGKVYPQEGVISAPIGRAPKDRLKFSVRKEGKEATTYFKVIKYLDNFSYLQVEPKTGRTHQIRVHFASIRHPIVGDRLYGYRRQKMKITRQFLHSYKLKFIHPQTKKTVEFRADLPDDLKLVLKSLKSVYY